MRKVWVVAAHFSDYEWSHTAHIAAFEREADATAEKERLSVLLPDRMRKILDDESRIDTKYFDGIEADAMSHDQWMKLKERVLKKTLKGTGLGDDFEAYRANYFDRVYVFWLPFFAGVKS